MNEVRIAVQRAIDKLVNRFGKQSDVIGELRAALAALDRHEKKGVETTVALPAVSEVSIPVTPEEPEAEPPPEIPVIRRAYGGRKK